MFYIFPATSTKLVTHNIIAMDGIIESTTEHQSTIRYDAPCYKVSHNCVK